MSWEGWEGWSLPYSPHRWSLHSGSLMIYLHRSYRGWFQSELQGETHRDWRQSVHKCSRSFNCDCKLQNFSSNKPHIRNLLALEMTCIILSKYQNCTLVCWSFSPEDFNAYQVSYIHMQGKENADIYRFPGLRHSDSQLFHIYSMSKTKPNILFFQLMVGLGGSSTVVLVHSLLLLEQPAYFHLPPYTEVVHSLASLQR